MFEVSVEDAKFWKNCIDAIVNLIDEGVLEAKADGIALRAMDPSQIAMVSFFVPRKSFVDYKTEGTEKIGLNFDNLSKFLARAREKEKLTMVLEDNKLGMEFSGEGKRSFKIPLLDLSTGPQKEPKIEYDATVKVNAGQFKEILRDATLVSSHLTLEVSEAGFFIDAKGDSADLNEKAAAELAVKKPARATFPLQFLDDIARACPNDAQITLHLKTNAPVKVEYAIGDAALTYYLAPRIEAG